MVETDFNLLINKLVRETGLSENELLNRINNKINELSGLVSRNGAAHIIATELGVKLTSAPVKQFVELDKIVPGLSNITVIGRVTNLAPIREFDKNGKKGQVSNLLLTDGSGSARLVFWNEHTKLLSSSRINLNDIIRVHHVRSKQGLYGMELHFTPRSRIEVNPEGIKVNSKIMGDNQGQSQSNICDLHEGTNSSIRGCVVQLAKRNPLYEVCPSCSKKLNSEKQCPEHNFKDPGHSMVINAIIDDGTGTINCTFFGKTAESLLNCSASQAFEQIKTNGFEELIKLKELDLLGNEILINGKVSHNNFADRAEIIVRNFNNVNPALEAKKLLKTL